MGKNNFLRLYAIYGAGSHGKVMADALSQRARDKEIELFGLFDDDAARVGQRVCGYSVCPKSGLALLRARGGALVVAIADNTRRAAIVQNLAGEGHSFFVAVHPSAVISASARIGEGCMLSALAVVNPDAVIGTHTIINTGAVIEHNNIIGSFCHIAPGVNLGGRVKVGDFTDIFTNATVLPDVTIGSHCVVGAGAVVLRDVSDYVTVVGNPARILKKE